jgi:hypothetical protein
MVKRQNSGWRVKAAAGALAGIGALYPVAGMAQTSPDPSGAAVQVGGVSVTAQGGAQQGRPVVLPNTGGGPADDASSPAALGALLGVLGLGAATYLRYRSSRKRVGG